MNKRQLGAKLTLDALGIPLKLGKFDERLIVQKAMYLATAAGHDCGYYFRWYLRGPYCSELTRDVFSINAEVSTGEDESSRWTLDSTTKTRLERIKRLVPADTTAAAQKLELLASVHYLVDRRQVPGADVDAIVQLLRRYGKDFSRKDVETALHELRTNGLLPR